MAARCPSSNATPLSARASGRVVSPEMDLVQIGGVSAMPLTDMDTLSIEINSIPCVARGESVTVTSIKVSVRWATGSSSDAARTTCSVGMLHV